jgi:hypothetical protein
MAVGCRKDGENLNRKLAQKTAILAGVLTITFAYYNKASVPSLVPVLAPAASGFVSGFAWAEPAVDSEI